jgi:hypothetical protein
VLIRPEFWNRRRLAIPGREPFELPTTSRRALQGAGSGVSTLQAVIGGFHLAGPLFEPVIADTVTALEQPAPRQVRQGWSLPGCRPPQ